MKKNRLILFTLCLLFPFYSVAQTSDVTVKRNIVDINIRLKGHGELEVNKTERVLPGDPEKRIIVIKDSDTGNPVPEANVEILLVIYTAMKANDVSTAYKLFVKALLSSNSFDYGLILYYRYMLMQFIKRNEKKLYLKDFAIKIGNLLPIEYETDNGDFLFDNFYKNYFSVHRLTC